MAAALRQNLGAVFIDEPVHGFIENTIPSMQAAFDLGADAVEFDVKCSKDNQLAVFHDSTLLFRCGIEGEVQDYTMAELKQMDASNSRVEITAGKGSLSDIQKTWSQGKERER